jgi:hypothetical protein
MKREILVVKKACTWQGITGNAMLTPSFRAHKYAFIHNVCEKMYQDKHAQRNIHMNNRYIHINKSTPAHAYTPMHKRY